MHARASVLVSAAALNAAAFVAAAALLNHLGRVVLGDARRARAAALLFCITPAGVFMSAVYSERCGRRRLRLPSAAVRPAAKS